jgi:hypothetical protein
MLLVLDFGLCRNDETRRKKPRNVKDDQEIKCARLARARVVKGLNRRYL